MKISYDSEQLISDVRDDIELFGTGFKVYAVYSYQVVNGQDFEYISSYVDADKPLRDEADTQEEYEELLSDYEANIASLKETKHELMTVSELINKLNEQNSMI